MLSNAYFLAKFRFDTAENEPVKHLQNFAKNLQNFAKLQNRASAADLRPVTARQEDQEQRSRALAL